MRAADDLASVLPEHRPSPEVDAIVARWDDDGASRGPAFVELRDKARQFERCYGAALELVRALLANECIAQAHVRKRDALLSSVRARLVERGDTELVALIDGPPLVHPPCRHDFRYFTDNMDERRCYHCDAPESQT